MQEIEPITVYLKRKLREAGASRFDSIAQAAGVNASFIRKFFYGSRENPRVQTVQPLIDYFAAVERGERQPADDVPQGEATDIKTKANAGGVSPVVLLSPQRPKGLTPSHHKV